MKKRNSKPRIDLTGMKFGRWTAIEYVKPGKWKKCSRCGQIKLAHNNFFSKNKTSKDHFYSICKCCRNKKK